MPTAPLAPRSVSLRMYPHALPAAGIVSELRDQAALAERAYREAVFRARWADGRDIADRDVLGDCARDAGLSRDDLVKRLDHEQYRNAFWVRAAAGIEDRVFGVPFFVFDGERFWGNDRIEFLLDAVRGRPVSG